MTAIGPTRRLASLSAGASRLARVATGSSAALSGSAVALVSRAARRNATEAMTLAVDSVVWETEQCRTLKLRPLVSAPVRPFKAGQYLQVAVEIGGEVHRRSYSISAAEGKALQITVKAVGGGLVSRHLVEAAKPGDTLEVKGPAGRFVLPDNDRGGPLCFLAAGSGITPIHSMITTALAVDAERTITLVYANRAAEETIFAAALDELAAMHPRVQIVHVHSRPGASWTGLRGRLDAERAVDLLAPASNAEVFLCGPGDLIEGVSQALQRRGVPEDRIHSESYVRKVHRTPAVDTSSSVSVAAGAESEGDGPRITWKRSDVAGWQHQGETLLAASQRVHADVAYICESGECGSCLVQVVSGDVAHDEGTCLTEADREGGYVLACSSYARTDVVLDA